MIVAIHQPNFIPWAGYFYKINQSDLFVLLDNVQYSGGGADAVINRNKIKTPNGASVLTVPVKKAPLETPICEMLIDERQQWAAKFLKTIRHSYARAPYFNEIFGLIESAFLTPYTLLSELNTHIIISICSYLEINTKFVKSSEIVFTDAAKDDLLIDILKYFNADTYLSGKGGLKYMDLNKYEQEQIQVRITEFTPPVYPQLHGEFISNLSFIDVLFNCGKSSLSYL